MRKIFYNKYFVALLACVLIGLVGIVASRYRVVVTTQTMMPTYTESPLAIAIEQGESFQAIEAIVVNDPALVNELSVAGFSPLAIAAIMQRYDVMKMLLERGAESDVPLSPFPGGLTVLHIAIQTKDCEMLCLLIRYDHDVDAESRDGQSASAMAFEMHGAPLADVVRNCGCD